ncbi:MAG: LacI family DNA-binding transcriptional regulator [Verrucomicrobia bacterium]|nr:LacI family DNA-binding transcriptional regulator [Verrucomicrobiota bacterium]
MNLRQSLHRKPLHIQVSEILRKKIIPRFEPGEKIDAESKLARQLGISVVTLRQSLSVLEHEGILERRHGSGTYVADRGAKQHIAVVTHITSNVRDWSFQLRVFRALGTMIRERGYQHRFYVSFDPGGEAVPLEFADELAHGRICGVAFVAMGPAPALLQALQEQSMPFAICSENYPHGVQVDYVGMVRDGTRHLLEQGCRRIALMQWFALPGEQPLADRSLEAFKTVLSEYGAPYEERWVWRAVPPDVGGAGWEQFREIWAAGETKPDGLVVTDDVLFRDVALGILDSRIQVPDQLRVITHANKGSGIGYPFPVTFLEIDPQEFAEALADGLIRLMKNEKISAPVRYIQARLLSSPCSVTSDHPSQGDFSPNQSSVTSIR